MRLFRRLLRLARLPFIIAGLVVALAGCGGDRIFAPSHGPGSAGLDATLTRLADGSVSVHAVVTNTSEATIQGVAGCGSTGIGMTVHGPAGPVPLTDPCIITIGMPCLPGRVPLAPGDRVESTYTYDGHQYTVCHTPETIPPGTYEIVVTFTWYSRGTRLKTLTRRLPFDWPAP